MSGKFAFLFQIPEKLKEIEEVGGQFFRSGDVEQAAVLMFDHMAAAGGGEEDIHA